MTIRHDEFMLLVERGDCVEKNRKNLLKLNLIIKNLLNYLNINQIK